MKKIAAIIFAFVSVFAYGQKIERPNYGDFFKSEMIVCGISFNGGVSFSCDTKLIPTVGMDFCIEGIMAGFGIVPGWGETSDKSVNVNSYNRVQNGKNVHVKSYKRAKPGSGGGRGRSEMSEIYIGYWFPCLRYKHLKVYSSPIIGCGKKLIGNDIPDCVQVETGDKFLLYGAGLNATFGVFGLSIKATNASATIGLALNIPQSIARF